MGTDPPPLDFLRTRVLEGELLFVAALLTVVLVSAAGCYWIFRKRWRRPSPLRGLAQQIVLASASLLLCLALLDLLFYAFYLESDGMTSTLSGKRWFGTYWGPLNELEYRDDTISRLEGHPLIVVLGDSFAAGHGVADYEERLSNRLEKSLDSEWRVATVATPGWDTREQTRALVEFPHDPSVVILSYVLNDVEPVARENGIEFAAKAIRPPTGLTGLVVEHSYLWNHAYYRLARARLDGPGHASYLDTISRGLANETVGLRHRQDLSTLVEAAEMRGAEVIALVWPFLSDLGRSSELTSRVTSWLELDGVRVIDLSPVFADREPSDLMVGPLDAHPNSGTHGEVARLLHEQVCDVIRRDGWKQANGCRSVSHRGHDR